MANFSSNKQLNINCTIGAIYLPKTGSIQGFQAQSRTRNNQNSTLSQSYIHQAESLGTITSKKLGNISKGSGGIIPKVNLTIGAPSCTFAEGAIGPDIVHPVLDKLKGAITSKFIPNISYNIPTDVIASTTSGDSEQGNITLPSVAKINLSGASATIHAKQYYSNNNNVYATYNIWKQILTDTASESQKKYLIHQGVTNYEQLNGVHMATQVLAADSAQITVHAQQRRVVLKRIFPIADDLLYQSPIISYHNGRADKKLNIVGGRNCGFHVRMYISSINLHSNQIQNNNIASEVIINFGRNSTEKNTISHFSIIMNQNSTFLRYESPIDRQLFDIPLQGHRFSEGLNDVFVHFAGPNMYIGFSYDVEQWNVIEPINLKRPTELKNDSNSYECRISSQAEIYLILNNLQCSFTYSPICFDNMNWENIITTDVNQTLQASNDPNEIFRGQNFINLAFEVSSENQNAINSINPSIINEGIRNNSTPSKFKDKSLNSSFAYSISSISGRQNKTKEKAKPSVYWDWRAYNSNLYDIVYYQTGSTSILRGSDNPRVRTFGRITYDSDITGSIFFYARNYPDAQVVSNNLRNDTSELVVNIWNGYNDVTHYLYDAQITENYKNSNRSVRTSTALLKFRNMTHDNIGRQILNAIQENVLTFTLRAGYGLDLTTFFVGVSTKVEVFRSQAEEGYTVHVTCEDLGHYLLSTIRFPVNNDVVLSYRTYGNILRDCFIFANLEKYYFPRPRLTGYDPLYDDYFLTLSGSEDYNNPVHLKAITAAREKFIIEAIDNLLSIMMVAEAQGENIGRTSPVLYFDYENLNYKITTRGSEPLEYIYFIPDNQNGTQVLPYQLDDYQNIHGLALGNWEEETDLNNLKSKITFIYQDYHSSDVLESNTLYIDSAVSSTQLSRLNSLVGPGLNSQPYLGYIGYNREDYFNDIDSPDSKGMIQSRALARKLFNAKQIIGRKTFQTLSLNIYVNRPLTSFGLFRVQAFEGGVDVPSYQEYIFVSIIYKFNLEDNLITAKIDGEYNPSIL